MNIGYFIKKIKNKSKESYELIWINQLTNSTWVEWDHLYQHINRKRRSKASCFLHKHYKAKKYIFALVLISAFLLFRWHWNKNHYCSGWYKSKYVWVIWVDVLVGVYFTDTAWRLLIKQKRTGPIKAWMPNINLWFMNRKWKR